MGAVGTRNPQWNASSIFYLKGEATMKQSKLIRKVTEQVERTSKQSQRETEQDVRAIRKEMDAKIKNALDNPLANK